MASFNQCILVGNLARDPETKYLQSGTAVCEFGLAVNDRVKKGNDWIDEVSFFDVVFFGRTAEVCGEYLAKGANVLIAGRLKQETWEKDGQKRSKIKVVGDRMQMLGQKKRDEYDQRPESEPEAQAPPQDRTTQEEIPF